MTQLILAKIISTLSQEPYTKLINDSIEYRLGYVRALLDVEIIDIETAAELINLFKDKTW